MRKAPDCAKKLVQALADTQTERVVSTDESDNLAEQYITANVVGESSLDDCRHIALATIAQADAIVSWNFKHIVGRREGYNSVNKAQGYPEIKILTPKQLLEDNDDES